MNIMASVKADPNRFLSSFGKNAVSFWLHHAACGIPPPQPGPKPRPPAVEAQSPRTGPPGKSEEKTDSLKYILTIFC